jgi:DNA-binding PadR family transcriptional regulator
MEIESKLPLREATFFILLSLAPGARHGYAIIKDVQTLSDGRVTLSTGTLYGALKRLLGSEWVERVNDDQESENGRVRKSYRLTTLGRRILKAEAKRLESLVLVMRQQEARSRT